MSDRFKRILVTSALPYANGPLHVGHLAGVYVPSDIYVRYQRLKKRDVIHICGSDEHGVPITIRADKEKLTPREIVDRYHESMKTSFQQLGVSFDNYSRTSLPIHHETTQAFFLKLLEKDVLHRKTIQQLYCETCNRFLPDRYVQGTCPACGSEEAKGDQCEKCGRPMDQLTLISPQCALCGNVPKIRETSHWFFDLQKIQPDLERWHETHPEWKDNVRNYCRGAFEEGLRERPITRDLNWGVRVPLEEDEGKVFYVWFDAPIGYISSTKEWAAAQGDPERWRTYWCDPETKLIHFIGKDNIFFHALLFPAMLHCHGNFILPENVPAYEFLNLESQKISTSKNWAVWLPDYLAEFEPDPLRYYLTYVAPENQDSDFKWREFQNFHNSHLADVFGNFVNRAISMTYRYFEGRLPARGTLEPADKEMLDVLQEAPAAVGELHEEFHLRDATAATLDVARAGNAYLQEQQPWKLAKENRERCGTVLNIALETCKTLAILFHPILPFSCAKIWRMLNLPGGVEDQLWDEAAVAHKLAPGHNLGEPEILFRKIEDAEIQRQLDKLKPQEKPAEGSLSKETISYADVEKVDLRVADVIAAEAVAKTDKLLKLRIRLGTEERTIVAGIAQFYSAEEMVGKQIVVVTNLQPVKIRGIESNGMLLAADDGERLTVITPAQPCKSRARVI